MVTMKPKARTTKLALLCVGALLGAGLLRAGPYEDLSREINEVAARQFNLQAEARELATRLETALREGTHDTPAMKATRARIAEFKRQLLAAEAELRKQFEALPALQADIAKARADRAAIGACDRQRRELLERREKLFKQEAKRAAPDPSAMLLETASGAATAPEK
jgi:chromosome segregation ATPase